MREPLLQGRRSVSPSFSQESHPERSLGLEERNWSRRATPSAVSPRLLGGNDYLSTNSVFAVPSADALFLTHSGRRITYHSLSPFRDITNLRALTWHYTALFIIIGYCSLSFARSYYVHAVFRSNSLFFFPI